MKLTEEVRKYRIHVLGISSIKRKGKGTSLLNDGWQLFYSGVDITAHAQAGVGILLHPCLADAVLDWKPANERVVHIRLQLKKKVLTIIQVYAPNTEADYETFLETVLTTMESVPKTDSILLMGDFNAHVGNDSRTWNNVIGRPVVSKLKVEFNCSTIASTIQLLAFHYQCFPKHFTKGFSSVGSSNLMLVLINY